ncbi:hypothetical protein LR48_Vigan02g127300 [Vigna angularis]|uniref:Uncharacterized protein n=1 Tax=Phaseolus angularis TaxID=3914 RepID=A0A0L9TX08_PHAAN|nr:hypothetical protein LR48_Vigan02g127300 [Vigna angularis]
MKNEEGSPSTVTKTALRWRKSAEYYRRLLGRRYWLANPCQFSPKLVASKLLGTLSFTDTVSILRTAIHIRRLQWHFVLRFIPSRVASQAITRSIKQQFLSPCPTWGAIPDDDKKPFWERFQAQALGRAVHVDEVFAQTHVRKGTNQFVDERSRKTHEEFSTRLSQVRSEHESAPTPDDDSNAEDDIPSKFEQRYIDLHRNPIYS